MGKMNSDPSKKELIKEIHDLKEKSIITDELVDRLCEAIQEASIREKELHAIMNGSKAVLEQKGFTESARAIFDPGTPTRSVPVSAGTSNHHA